VDVSYLQQIDLVLKEDNENNCGQAKELSDTLFGPNGATIFEFLRLTSFIQGPGPPKLEVLSCQTKIDPTLVVRRLSTIELRVELVKALKASD